MNNVQKLDGLSQLLVVRSFYEMVKDADMKGTDFINLIVNQFLNKETLEKENQFRSYMGYLSSIVYNYLPKKYEKKMTEFVFNKLHELHAETENPKYKVLLVKKMVSFGITESTIEKLKVFFDESIAKKDFSIGKYNLHTILFKLTAQDKYTAEEKTKFFDDLKSIDSSDDIKDSTLKLKYLQADFEERKTIIDKILKKEGEMSYKEVKNILVGIFSRYVKPELKEPFYEQFIACGAETLQKCGKTLGEQLLNYFNTTVEDCDKKIKDQEKILNGLTDKFENFRTEIKKTIFTLKQVKKCKALYTEEDDKKVQEL